MVLWYLPVHNSLRRFFSNPKDDEPMRCGIQISARRATESLFGIWKRPEE
jgi:hypothetical protein